MQFRIRLTSVTKPSTRTASHPGGCPEGVIAQRSLTSVAAGYTEVGLRGALRPRWPGDGNPKDPGPVLDPRATIRSQPTEAESAQMRRVVTYIRIAEGKQGRCDRAAEEQRATLARFIQAEGCEALAEFIEVGTGKRADRLDHRPQLAAAIAAARKREAAVLVASLDRLSRDVHFVSALVAQRVPFIVAAPDRRDGPSAAAALLRRSVGRLKRPRPIIEPSKPH